MSICLSTAEKIAAKIVYELAPFCHRIEIAGSIRRQRPEVGDIDLVAIPKHRAALVERIARNCRIRMDAEQTIVAEMKSGIQIDLWLARPEKKDLLQHFPTNFGTLLLCRTGSRAHNIHLLARAESLGMRWNTYHGVFAHRQCLACAEEADIFRVLGLEFVEPQDRER
jgi:DNA polymerase/3'-5' exonuclease PolX